MNDLKHIIESLLFVSQEPLTLNRIIKIIPNAGIEQVRTAINDLQAELEQRGGGFYLREVAGGFQFCTRPEYNKWIRRLIQPKTPRLSTAALETLAIIAYKQPVIRSDIEHIRGVDCGGVLRALLERKLVRVMGRKEIPGRPLIYGTTKQFLEVFELKNLKDLPTLKEIEALAAQPSAAEGATTGADDEKDVSNQGINSDNRSQEPHEPPGSTAAAEKGDEGETPDRKIGKNT